jgi:hypothetical protein
MRGRAAAPLDRSPAAHDAKRYDLLVVDLDSTRLELERRVDATGDVDLEIERQAGRAAMLVGGRGRRRHVDARHCKVLWRGEPRDEPFHLELRH